MTQKKCAYPNCANHKKGVKHYCCNGCRWDHQDAMEADGTLWDDLPVAKINRMHAQKLFNKHKCATAQPGFWAYDLVWTALFAGVLRSAHERGDDDPRYSVCDTGSGFVVYDMHNSESDYMPVRTYLPIRSFRQIAICHSNKVAEAVAKALNKEGIDLD